MRPISGLVLLTVVLAGCSLTGSTPDTLATVGDGSSPPNGQATISGTLVMVGGPPPGIRTPLSGEISVEDIHQVGSVVFNVEVGPDGRFSEAVEPGTYQVVGISPSYNGGKGTCHPATPDGTVSVQVGEHVEIDVACQIM